MAKLVVGNLADVPEAIRGEYEPTGDGRYKLKVEGEIPGLAEVNAKLADVTARLAQFRDTNVTLLRAAGASSPEEATARLAALQGVDVDEYKRLKDQAEQLARKGVKTGDDLDALRAKVESLEAAVPAMQKRLDTEVQTRTAAEQRAANALLRTEIGGRFLKAGGRSDALDFVIAQAQRYFRVDGDNVVPLETALSTERPGQPLSTEEFLALEAKQHSFAFGPTVGGGTTTPAGNPRSVAGARVIVNPTPSELGQLKYVSGKGMTDSAGQPVVIQSTE